MIADLDQLLIVSADFARAPIELREWLACGQGSQHPAALLARSPGIREALWLESCDRVEAILLAASEEAALDDLARLWWRQAGVDMQEHWDQCAFYRGAGALQHLVNILCGVDVAFAGSLHLRCDFHGAWRTSWESGGMQEGLHRICREACHVAQSLVFDLAEGVSASLPAPYSPPPNAAAPQATAAAMRIIREPFGILEGRRALVIGAGRLGSALARAAVGAGMALTVADAYVPAARDLAARLGASWTTLKAWPEACGASDLVMAATSARKPLGTAPEFVRLGRESRARLFLDFSFPRAFPPEIQEWGVSLYNVDEIARRADNAGLERSQAQRRSQIAGATGAVVLPAPEAPDSLAPVDPASGPRPAATAGAA